MERPPEVPHAVARPLSHCLLLFHLQLRAWDSRVAEPKDGAVAVVKRRLDQDAPSL